MAQSGMSVILNSDGSVYVLEKKIDDTYLEDRQRRRGTGGAIQVADENDDGVIDYYRNTSPDCRNTGEHFFVTSWNFHPMYSGAASWNVPLASSCPAEQSDVEFVPQPNTQAIDAQKTFLAGKARAEILYLDFVDALKNGGLVQGKSRDLSGYYFVDSRGREVFTEIWAPDLVFLSDSGYPHGEKCEESTREEIDELVRNNIDTDDLCPFKIDPAESIGVTIEDMKYLDHIRKELEALKARK
ncbi:MAG: hypothetical protein A3I05_09430 [Deltaproteobacteria bacterium RIFCSPLOWO2_02_FULL_44_10]|nr:MAG: hypothetical protein A3C46_07550 [Deltaproteobacteria bacterium RIFCSPHIGHO2_02_FULL_44_16]OGQ47433.1 MAG: hypothetical protein A3I05_09430 [Deltaproteobacteria bacterium RIFCSPLOWO2_02_FULL_44_10]